MIELLFVLIGLLCHHTIVSLHSLHMIQIAVALEDKHILRLAILIGQIIGGYLVVVGG